MGNYCTNNFENVGQHEVIVPHLESSVKQAPSLYSNSPPIDQEAIHSTYKQKEPVMDLIESEESQFYFPHKTEVVSISSAQPQRIRHKLEELDLSFYHSLGLPDYEYRSIPPQDQQLFRGVETYELRDSYGVKYVGEWLNNHIHGNGVLLSNTSKYIGQFKFGLKHYHGRQILKNQVYEGQFEGGRRKGFGTKYTPAFTQHGTFDEELMEGQIVYLNGRVEKKTIKSKMNLKEDLKQDIQIPNRSLGSLYTDKYYEASELPDEWYEQSQLQKKKRGVGLQRNY